jgi:hypothetical protein
MQETRTAFSWRILNLSRSSGSIPEQITINLTPTSSGGGQVSFSVGNQGSNEQQITFSPNSNEQIVLNLLGESSSTSGGSLSGSPSANGGLNVSA